ncbi:MAG: hypothetical protein AcusKO_07560 [Acuticoccus sp.]
MTPEDFVARYANIYEHSPWVPQRAFEGGAEEGDDLAAIFRRIVERAGPEAHLHLLRVHPDLAGRLGTKLTTESTGEQAGAGLDRCTPDEYEAFQSLNQRYKERFGFPFIIAVTGLDRRQILAIFKERVTHDRTAEFRTALDEVHKIAAIRLAALAAPPKVPSEAVPLATLRDLVESAIARAGADAANTRAIADTILAAEADGSVSHGVFRAPGYAAGIRDGIVNGTAVPRLLPAPEAAVIVEGDGGSSATAYALGLPALAERAEALGAAVLCVRNVAHYAAMWHEVEFLAERGLAAFACTANFPYMAPVGGQRPFFGTNPVAFSFPHRDGPVTFDFALSTMARGAILIAARDGAELPPGVGLDAAGAPTRDPAAVLAGAQTPVGAHKGSALALMVELLAAGVVGDMFSDEATKEAVASGVPVGGVFVLALSPRKLGGDDALTRSAAFLDRLAAEPGVRLPGAGRRARRHAGDPYSVPVSVMDELRRVAGA